MSQPQLVEVNRYQFSADALATIQNNAYAANNWPLVYILSDERSSQAYVGESSDTISRLSTHLRHPQKRTLTTVHLVSSDRFNKSATLDIESSLIKYMSADGRFRLLNANLGLTDHNYYLRDELYSQIFRETWNKLRRQGVVQRSLEAIDNSDVFKYSPYKALSADQKGSLISILRALIASDVKNVVVQGGAGTGKSVLAIFLFKLIHSDVESLELHEFAEDEEELRDLVLQFRERFPEPRMALVVPMNSFRKTLKKAFSNVAGLNAGMVIGPSDLKSRQYDVVLVDESHRLRKRVNLTNYRSFDEICEVLGLDKLRCSEVDWVTRQSGKAVFFYDPNQSIKPSDANPSDFEAIKAAPDCKVLTLHTQFRVRAGVDYVRFVDDLLAMRLQPHQRLRTNKYDFLVFDDLADMVREIQQRNREHGLSRLVAGYAWPWVSRNDPSKYDIVEGAVSLQWNRTSEDWINSPGAEREVGCIHTTQGYDLNYTGVIFGHEIRYDEDLGQIVVDKNKYHDKSGRNSISDPEVLRQYILNIYRTIMLRGIRGTYVYACDDALRRYLKRHIASYRKKVVQLPQAAPLERYVNSVPLFDLKAAAGAFSVYQLAESDTWVPVPPGTKLTEQHFACRVVGESMNQIIPNGAICLFRKDTGGSRNGKIVLVECDEIQDAEGGSRYTVKEYESFKVHTEDGVVNERVLLKPRSNDPSFEPIELHGSEDALRYHVVGEFVRVIEEPEGEA